MDTTFILHIRDFHCSNCSHSWTSSDLYRCEIIGMTTHMEPSHSTPPIGCAFGTSRLPPKIVGVCYQCAPSMELERRKQFDLDAATRWNETLQRKALENQPIRISGAAKRRAAAPSIEDL